MKQPIKENPPVSTELQPIELGNGLDFTKPKLLVDPGSMLDCNNFEIIDRAGPARIIGCEPFDGTEHPIQFPWDGTIRRLNLEIIGAAPSPEDLAVATPLLNGGACFGLLLYVDVQGLMPPFTYQTFYRQISADNEPDTSDTVTFAGVTGSYDVTGNPANASQFQIDSFGLDLIPVNYTRENINAVAAAQRAETEAMERRAIGLHWFRDRLYAVANESTLFFNSGGTAELTLNQYIGTDTARGRVLSITLTSGSWAAGTATGSMQIDNITDTWPADVNDAINTYTDSTFTTIETANIATFLGETDNIPISPLAGLFVALDADQAADIGGSATAGWNRIDCGWEVDYEEGYSESGALVKVEKGTTPSYTPGSGTTSATTANLLVQAPTITGETTQVQGWKSTADETVFATDPSAVAADDNVYLYGDCLTYAWGLNSSGLVKTNQPSNGIGAEPSIPLAPYPATGESLSYTLPAPYSTTIRGSNGYTYFLLNGLDGLSAALPENARIVGITATVKYSAQVLFKGWPFSDAEIFQGFTNVRLEGQLMDYDAGTNEATKLGSPKINSLDYTFANFTENNDQLAGLERKVRWTKTAESTLTYGGASDLWGLNTLTRADTTDAGFTIGFRCTVDCGNTLPTIGNSNDNILIYRPLIDQITVAISYVTDSVRYYFKDGTDVIQGDLVYYNTVEGTFQAGDAEGTMQLVNVVKQAGTKYMIESGMDIHTALPATSGNKVGVTASAMAYNGLPGLQGLIDNNSRYEFITANFYGRDDLDGFYGASGAGKGFSVNTFLNGSGDPQEYLVKITTNPLDEAGDKPRHVAFHHYHLAYGFSSGIVRMSVQGEPEDFNGVLGAAEIGVGDKVTGLLSMKGMTLGVFCENSIWSIAGTDSDNFVTQVLAPYTGALEYTVVDMGIPMYCDSRGISTIEQSATYSNFQGARLSAPVTPWILPRMVRITDLDSTTASNGVACAIPVRAKNHYRVFFRDGRVLCASISPSGPPAFTFSTYYIGMDDLTETDKFLVPLAWSSQVDERGVERVHVSHYSATSAITDADALYVYELERGWGFAGRFIPAFFSTNWYAKDPYTEKTIKNIRMEGLTLGYGSTVVSLAKEYEEVYNTVVEPISLPKTPWDEIETDYKPTSSMAHIARTGRNFSIKIEDVIPSGDTITDPVPPCIHQIMLTQYAPMGKTDS